MLRLPVLAILGLTAFLLVVRLNNLSLFAPGPLASGLIIAHRGVHQTFTSEGLTDDSCTATMIHPVRHPFLENTIASIEEAFRLGADIVEIDIHPTADGHFAVFGDRTVDCRTDGTGATRELSLAYLKTLDIGYGYSADGRKTFPLRGTGRGLMPSFDEVLGAFPAHRFLINIKSNEARHGEQLATRLAQLPRWRRNLLTVHGAERPIAVLRKRIPGLRLMDPQSAHACLYRYVKFGWSGHVPAACRNSILVVPRNYTWMMWGWPDRLRARMDEVDVPVLVAAPLHGGVYDPSLDEVEDITDVPSGYGFWTNRIETMRPQ